MEFVVFAIGFMGLIVVLCRLLSRTGRNDDSTHGSSRLGPSPSGPG